MKKSEKRQGIEGRLVLSRTTLKNLSVHTGVKTGWGSLSDGCSQGPANSCRCQRPPIV